MLASILQVVGVTAVVVGVALISIPVAVIVGGAAAFTFGWFMEGGR